MHCTFTDSLFEDFSDHCSHHVNDCVFYSTCKLVPRAGADHLRIRLVFFIIDIILNLSYVRFPITLIETFADKTSKIHANGQHSTPPAAFAEDYDSRRGSYGASKPPRPSSYTVPAASPGVVRRPVYSAATSNFTGAPPPLHASENGFDSSDWFDPPDGNDGGNWVNGDIGHEARKGTSQKTV